MANILYYTHTGTRWLVVLAIVFALGFMIYSLVTKREQDRVTRIAMLAFSSLIGIQWIVGILYYLTYGNLINNYTRTGWTLHLTVMTIALVTAHLYLPFRRTMGNRGYYIASLVVVVLTSGLIIYGTSALLGTLASRWSLMPLYPPA